MTTQAQTMAPPKDKAVAFSRPEQVFEILNEAHRQKLQVLVRFSNDGKAVRGFVENVDKADLSLRIGGISVAGDDMLRGHDFVKVEFILLSKKLVFVSKIRARVTGKLMLSIPEKLVAIERRTNVRFRVPASHAAFIELPERRIDVARFDAPFVPPFMREQKNFIPRLRVDDVSLGGVAIFTRYTALADVLKADEEELTGTLYFPNHTPVQVPISIRWTKKTIAAVPAGKFDEVNRVISQKIKSSMASEPIQMKETYFRIGLQFSEVSKDLDGALRSFIRLVQTAESV